MKSSNRWIIPKTAHSCDISGYDTLNSGQSDVLSAAKYDWVQSAVSVVASGRELRDEFRQVGADQSGQSGA